MASWQFFALLVVGVIVVAGLIIWSVIRQAEASYVDEFAETRPFDAAENAAKAVQQSNLGELP